MHKFLAAGALLLIAAACKDNTEKEVVPPKACANFPSELLHGIEGTFDGSCSNPADKYVWTFGDGTELDGPTVTHTFLAPGKYAVNLTTFKDGKRDDNYGYINITATEKEQDCLPAYVTGVKIWPFTDGDSVVFVFDYRKQLNEIYWYQSGATIDDYVGRATISHDAQFKINGVEFINRLQEDFHPNLVDYGVAYDENDLPTRMEGGYYAPIVAEYTHDVSGRLTSIKYTDKDTPGISQTTTYQYDAYGNTAAVSYSGYGTKGEGRENTAFHSTLTFYEASVDLKFYLEYIVGVEPYVNSLKWATVKADRGGPGWANFKSYTDPDMNNPPGLDREYAVKIDPNTNLPVQLTPNTGDVVGTDLTYRNVVYKCDFN